MIAPIIDRSKWYSLGLPRNVQSIVWVSVLTALLVVFFDLLSHLLNFKRWISILTPMAIIPAVIFIITALGLVALRLKVFRFYSSIIVRAVAIITSLVVLFDIYAVLYYARTGSNLLTGYSPFLDHTTSFLPAAFLLLSSALFLLASTKKWMHNLAHLLNIVLFYISWFFITAHLLRIYSIANLNIAPVGLTTDIAFLCLAWAIFFLRPHTWLMKVYTSGFMGSIIARRITIPLIILPVIVGWLRINGERNGVFRSEEGVILVSLSFSVISLFLIWFSARYGNNLDKLRQKADEDLHYSNARLELLSEISARLLASENPQHIVNDLCSNICTFLNCDFYFNYFADTNKKQLHLNACAGIPEDARKEIKTLDYGVAVCGCVARDEKRIIAENIQQSDDPMTAVIRTFGVQAYVCHPLLSGNKVIGTLSFGTSSKTRFNAEEISLMKVVSDQVSIAMNRILHQKALIESEDRFRKIAELLPVQITISRISDSTLQYANEAYQKFLGYSADELIGKPAADVYYNPSDRDEIIKILKEKKRIENAEIAVKNAEGEPLWVSSSALEVVFEGEPSYLSATYDITQRKKDEEALVQLNRTLNAYSKSSKAMSHIHDEFDYLNEVCKIITEDCGHLMVWIGYTRDDDHKTVEPVAYYGFDESYIEKMHITWDDSERGNGPTGTAIKTARPVICRDMLSDPAFAPWREEAQKRGYICSLVIPLISDNKVFGSISIYSTRPDSFYDEEVNLLTDIANDLAYGISKIRLEVFERKAAETIRNSEEKYRLLFNGMTEGFALCEIITDQQVKPYDFRYLSINPAFTKQTGMKAEEVIGKSVLELIPNIESYWLETYGRVALTGESTDFENYNAALNKYFRVSAFSPERGFFAVIFEDVTARVMAVKELNRTKNYLENLINYASAPIVVWDKDIRIERFNRAFEVLTGYSSAEVEGRKIEMLFPPLTLSSSLDRIHEAIEHNMESNEIPIITKSGNIRTILWNSANIYDSDTGEHISTIAQGNDITERIIAESQVRDAKQKLDLTLENASIGIWEWNTEEDLIEIDKRIGKMLGIDAHCKYTFDEFVKNIYDEDIAHFSRAVRNSVQTMIPLDTIFRIRKNDHEYISINAKGRIVRNGTKENKITGVFVDITEMKKRTDQTLFNLNEELLRSNKELEQFAYVASHDLQEPLRMISSFTQLLGRRYGPQLDQQAHEFINYAVDGAARMQTLINDLLEYSRINTRGKEFTPVDMHQVLGQTMHNLSVKINEKGALITNDDLPVIMADSNQMVQLMQNLIDNALKFAEGSPRIHISATEEQNQYVIMIKDNGIGIESQYFDRIFQIFQRLHLRDSYGGTGIGLAICKRIIERHGGKIWVESTKGEGTIFKFTALKAK